MRSYNITIRVPYGSSLRPSRFGALIADLPTNDEGISKVHFLSFRHMVKLLPTGKIRANTSILNHPAPKYTNMIKTSLDMRSPVTPSHFPTNVTSSAKILRVTWYEGLNRKNHLDDISRT